MTRLLAATESSPWLRLLEWLGYDFSNVPAGAKPEFQWTNFPASTGVFVLFAVVAVILYGVWQVYRRELDSCPREIKWLLASLRGLVVLLLTLIFLGPAIVLVRQRIVKPTIVVGRDASQSMATADEYRDDAAAAAAARLLQTSVAELRQTPPTRVQLVERALDPAQSPLLEQIAQRGAVQVLDFADKVSRLDFRAAASPPAGSENANPASEKPAQPSPGGVPSPRGVPKPALPPLPSIQPTGPGTDLWTLVREGIALDNPAAVVVFTDGQHTAKDNAQAAAQEAAAKGVPLFFVGVGDPTRPRNLKVTNVYARPQVWQEEPFEIEAMILAQGVDANDVRVELIEQRLGESDAAVGDGVTVAAHNVRLPAGGGLVPVPFSHTAKEAGRYVYSVRVESVDGERDEADNQANSAVIKALSREKVRVLLVAGAPTWDFRLVQKLLARDKTMTVSCWLQTLDEERAQEGTRQITRLPVTRDELFWYDVVLLFDPDSQEFDQPWIELLKQFVGEHAGGLLFMAGPKHSGRLLTGPRTSEFQKLMPVAFGDVGALEVAALLTSNQRAWPVKLVPAAADHPVLRFYGDRQQTVNRWETLPGLFWSFPCKEPKPTAQVLLEHSDPTLRSVEGSRPLLVAGRYGAGNTLYIGFNGAWRWRRAGQQAEFFDKFWVQAVRYLVEGRSLEGRRRGFLQAERDRYEVGQQVTITARLQDAAYNPLAGPKVDATLQAAGEPPQPLELKAVANQQGVFEATFLARQLGVHTVRVPLVGGEADGGQVEAVYTVELPSVEKNEVWLNKPLLGDLAQLSGGKYFEIDQLDQLAAALPDKTEIIETRDKPDPLWDVRGMLVALVVLLGGEWFIRKQYKLL